MIISHQVSCILLANVIAVFAIKSDKTYIKGQPNNSSASNSVVNLGYARYQGYHDSTHDLNVWKGIRYAAPPTGKHRWQPPRTPLPITGNPIIQAQTQPPLCPQTGPAKVPKSYGFGSALGDEDCLYLNVYAPPEAKDLPVFFWIHGGGYGVFGATYDPSPIMNTNANGFVSVITQYRLGAFGFLSSDEVHRYGKVNAGLLDQSFALEWVQNHIEKFGGDPKRVTIGGESAGAGSVMLHAMAYGGKQNVTLFDNLIAASPYLPLQYNYNDPVSTQKYLAFAKAAGCADVSKTLYSTIFTCLVNANSTVLQKASVNVSDSGAFGTFGFLPVTDGEFIQERPSQQLLSRKVNGKRILIGNNANEGVPLSPPTIKTADDLLDYINTAFPHFSQADTSRLLQLYQFDRSPVNRSIPRFDTLGDRGPTALNQSEFATGQQQRLFNIYGETTFTCPSYWLAEAFSGDRQSWKYQYSVTPANHGSDITAYFPANATTPTKDFMTAFQKAWGNFIIHNTPMISIPDAKGNATNSTVPQGRHGRIAWPTYSRASPIQMVFNTTGGHVTTTVITDDLTISQRVGPGVTNEFRLVDASTWEGGRGARCDFWREVGPRVPE